MDTAEAERSTPELTTSSVHVAMLNVLADYGGATGDAWLYYPGCSVDESPEDTVFKDQTTYVDTSKTAVEAQRLAGHQAFCEDAEVFTPPERPDAIVFFNASGISIAKVIQASGIKPGGLIATASRNAEQITDDLFEGVPGLEVVGVITCDENGVTKFDENIDAYKPIESNEVLQQTFPGRYDHLVNELRKLGIADSDMQVVGIAEVIRQIREQMRARLAKMGLEEASKTDLWFRQHDLDVPSLKTLDYDLVVARMPGAEAA